MNAILEKIFSIPYFPYIIGGIIAFLVILFVIVLIAGKKDQKKLEETQVLNTINDPNLIPNNTIDASFDIKPVSDDVYIEPVINDFDDIELPKEEEVYEPENDDVYIAAGAGPVKQEEIIPFDPDPVIEPYIPEDSVQNYRKVADEIDKELTELEKMGPELPKVAPVEVLSDNEPIKGESKIASKFVSQPFSSVGIPNNIGSTASFPASNVSSSVVEEVSDEEELILPKIDEK